MKKLHKILVTAGYTLLTVFVVFPLFEYFMYQQLHIPGGCFDTRKGYGWPMIFFITIVDCSTCCPIGVTYPTDSFILIALLYDLAYFASAGFLLYKLFKKVKSTNK